MAGITYKPDSLVFTERVVLVEGLVKETLTPGTTDPLGSVTTPEISPAVDWARMVEADSRKTKANNRDTRIWNPPEAQIWSHRGHRPRRLLNLRRILWREYLYWELICQEQISPIHEVHEETRRDETALKFDFDDSETLGVLQIESLYLPRPRSRRRPRAFFEDEPFVFFVDHFFN